MNNRQIIVFLLCFFALQGLVNGQGQIKISNDEGKTLGRFNTQLFVVDGPKLKQLRGNVPTVSASGKAVELILRIEDLRWFDNENVAHTVDINRSDIQLSDSGNIQISNSKSTFKLRPASKIVSDIKFLVKANGSYTMSLPFDAKVSLSKFIQSFEVEGLDGSSNSSKPNGAIAEIKKDWKETNKRDISAVEAYMSKYKNNQLAIDEDLLVIPDRTLRRLKTRLRDESEDSASNVGTDVASNSKSDDDGGADEVSWKEIRDDGTSSDYEDFLAQFPDSKYAEAAKAKLGLDANVFLRSSSESSAGAQSLTKKDNNIYSLDLSHLSDPKISFSHPDDIELYDNGGNLFDLKIKGSKEYKIFVTNPSTSDKYTFDLNNELKAKVDKNGKDFIFSIDGGVSPFAIEFYKDGEASASPEARFEDKTPDVANQITLTNKMLGSSGMDGDYTKVVLIDNTTEGTASFPINVSVEPQKTMSRLLLVLLILGIVLGGGAMVYFNQKKKKKRAEYLAKAKVLQQTQQMEVQEVSNVPPVTPVAAASITPNTPAVKATRKITINKPDRRFVPANGGSDFVSSGKMKFKRIEAKGGRRTEQEFAEALKRNKYAFMDLEELWPNTAIKELFLSKACVGALGAFLKEENLDKAIVEMDGAIPEVGGFLMGFHTMSEETGSIKVTMEEFVPFVPEYHDVFKIEIGTATLVQELGDAQDKHPDKDVIGWFHTHPGHGLFLSNSDLSVQRHFPLKHQIAMEIDSLTKTLDTAFFTRKKDGTINNVEHRHTGAKWFSWKRIEKI